MGWCACGCFHPSTKIAVVELERGQSKSVKAEKIIGEKDRFQVIGLANDTKLQNLTLQSSPVRITTKGKELKSLVVVETDSNQQLRLTEKHPVLVMQGDEGRMIQAKNLHVGDVLKTIYGETTKILKVNRVKYNGDVVNFGLENEGLLSHIVFAEGVAVGDLIWQSTLEDRQNQVLNRR